MIDFLLGVPGKLKTISDWLTANLSVLRAAKIDNLDVVLSTRAVATTAVSNADYTAGRGAKLDFLDAAVSSRMAGIKAIYTGTITITAGNNTADATITAVNLSKSLCFLNGFNTDQAYAIGNPMVYLGSTTTVTAYVRAAVSGASTLVRFTVIEFL